MDIIQFILAGAGVGFVIGLTGIGGGSLMTPLLMMFGIPLPTVIGTDLLYAAITKANGVFMHHKNSNIDWNIVKLLAIGSLPSSILTAYILKTYFGGANDYKHILTVALGIMLILTSLVLFFRDRIQKRFTSKDIGSPLVSPRNSKIITLISGIFLGIFVTLSSVGAGAFGTAVLIMLYPRLSAVKIIGTDLGHAVPLTLIAGLGHFLILGNIDFKLLACLLVGSIPAVYFGTKLSSVVPEKILRTILAMILLMIGIKFALS